MTSSGGEKELFRLRTSGAALLHVNTDLFEKRFLAQAPLNATLDAMAFNLPDSYLHPSVQNQIAITVYSALNSPTPPSARYALKLLQAYSKLVESTNSFVEDDDFIELEIQKLIYGFEGTCSGNRLEQVATVKT